jgi:aminotransferase
MRRRGGLAAFGKPFNIPRDELELSPIKAIELHASRLPDVVSLAQGIPSFDTPEPIKRYAAEKIAEGACAKYSLTPGLPQLRELISEALLRDGMRYDPDGEIIVTCGAIEAVTATLLTFLEVGDEVILTSPTYASYIPAIKLAGATPRFVPLNEDANFDLDPDAIGSAITRNTRAVLLCNPNNPTGTIYSAAETERMMTLAARHGLLVITDEVYKDFIYTHEPPGNPALLPGHRDRVVRVCSFSKAYGMTGWRVGFLHAARERVDAILKVHDALVTCAPVVSQYAAIAALELGEGFIHHFRDEFRRRRARIIERLDALPQVFDYQKPNASYFAFPRVKDTVALARDSHALAVDILERVRVAVVPGVAFGPTGESHLRFCYARDLADIDRAFDRLTDYFAGRLPRTYALPAPAAPPPVHPRSLVRAIGVEVLHGLARLCLARSHPRVVAIAGGRGKTVLKRTLADLLGRRLRVRSNPLSYNTEVGVAFAILDASFDTRRLLAVTGGMGRAAWHALFPEPVDVLILELGVRRPNDMRQLLRVVQPDVAVVTAIAPHFEDDQAGLSTLRNEMKELIDSSRGRHAALVICADDPTLQDLAPELGTHRFGKQHLLERDGHAVLQIGDRTYPLGREVVGDSSLYALLASVIVARHLEIDEATIERFLAG